MYKQFLSQDIIINPLTLNKRFNFEGLNNITSSGIDLFIGQNLTSSINPDDPTGSFNPNIDPITGYNSTNYQRLIYNSIKHLYYSNYLSSSYGSSINPRVLIPGADVFGDIYVGNNYNPFYDNYIQTTLNYTKSLSDSISVISIPEKLFGHYIQPKSFNYITSSIALSDDGEGNVIYNNGIVGSIFYPHGLIVINPLLVEDISTMYTASVNYSFNILPQNGDILQFIINTTTSSFYFTSSPSASNQCLAYTTGDSGSWLQNVYYPFLTGSVFGTNWTNSIDTSSLFVFSEYYSYLDNVSISSSFFIGTGVTTGLPGEFTTISSSALFGNNSTCSFSSSLTIYEAQYKCTIRENEYNYSLNPSLIKNDSTGSVYDYATGSYFSPYVSSIGLYDNDQNLLAVGKMSQPVPISSFIDTTILINIDLV